MKIASFVLMLMTATGAAQAGTVWGVDNVRRAGELSDRIIKIDTTNPGVVTNIGLTGVNTLMGGLDFDGSGNLFAYGQTTVQGLFSINKTTGAATLIGSGGLDAGYAISDLSYNGATGRMLGVGSAASNLPSQLYDIDLSTGVATKLFNITGPATFLNVGLATNAAGTSFLLDLVTDRMYEIVGTNANAMSSGFGFDANFSQGMAIDWSGTNDWLMGAINSTATANARGQLRSVNSATGATTLIGQIGPNDKLYETGDIAFETIPTPGAATLLGLGGLLAARRRR